MMKKMKNSGQLFKAPTGKYPGIFGMSNKLGNWAEKTVRGKKKK